MYCPGHFRVSDADTLRAFMAEYPLAVLVTSVAGRPCVSHVPLLWEDDGSESGRLIGHLARANPQCHVEGAIEAVAVFTGPNAYVSPSWYETKRVTGKVVPTWNYVAVQATGTLTFLDDPEAKRVIVSKLTDHHERGLPEPWSVADAPDSFVTAQLQAVRAFELRVSSLEGKWKLSQNRPEVDRAGALEGLAASEAPSAREVARYMQDLRRDAEE
ncbi:MAG: FMN-binding negative transcriptional regulator [Betaproteobacteria bacterium]|nr:FMN-binding negative transcriptional regulator [Betaproteobacteria bacterium]